MEFLVLAHWLYSKECCDEIHCHPVPCNEIVDAGYGWKWRGKHFFPAMLKTSPDGNCHVCIGNVPYCIYLPPAS